MDEELQIVDVWSDNLEDAFDRIRDLLEQYPYVSIDTEFPGIVVRPTSYLEDYNYQTVKCNVDLLNIIQLGLTFADSDGSSPNSASTWQFNFKFDLHHDMYAQNSIDLLKNSGIDFESHQRRGIDLVHFGELIMSSGLVMNEEIVWISFHGSYDFAYLLKLLTCTNLPSNQSLFFELLHDFFPSLYDIKFLLDERSIELSGRLSLQKLADHLDVKRVGLQHQAGSDSLVTSRTFFKLMQRYFENKLDDQKYQGIIYGLGKSAPSNDKDYSSSNTQSETKGKPIQELNGYNSILNYNTQLNYNNNNIVNSNHTNNIAVNNLGVNGNHSMNNLSVNNNIPSNNLGVNNLGVNSNITVNNNMGVSNLGVNNNLGSNNLGVNNLVNSNLTVNSNLGVNNLGVNNNIGVNNLGVNNLPVNNNLGVNSNLPVNNNLGVNNLGVNFVNSNNFQTNTFNPNFPNTFANNTFGTTNTFGTNTFGSSNTFGTSNTFGSSNTFGTNTFGNSNTFNSNTFGNNYVNNVFSGNEKDENYKWNMQNNVLYDSPFTKSNKDPGILSDVTLYDKKNFY